MVVVVILLLFLLLLLLLLHHSSGTRTGVASPRTRWGRRVAIMVVDVGATWLLVPSGGNGYRLFPR